MNKTIQVPLSEEDINTLKAGLCISVWNYLYQERCSA